MPYILIDTQVSCVAEALRDRTSPASNCKPCVLNRHGSLCQAAQVARVFQMQWHEVLGCQAARFQKDARGATQLLGLLGLEATGWRGSLEGHQFGAKEAERRGAG